MKNLRNENGINGRASGKSPTGLGPQRVVDSGWAGGGRGKSGGPGKAGGRKRNTKSAGKSKMY